MSTQRSDTQWSKPSPGCTSTGRYEGSAQLSVRRVTGAVKYKVLRAWEWRIRVYDPHATRDNLSRIELGGTETSEKAAQDAADVALPRVLRAAEALNGQAPRQ